MAASRFARSLAFVRDTRGAAAIELALGAVVLLAVSALCFDFYSRIKADAAVARMAVAMADYVSRDTAPNGDEMKALGDYLRKHELGIPADLVYVVTALHQPAGDPRPAVAVLWTDSSIRFGDEEIGKTLAGEDEEEESHCPQFVGKDENDNEVAVPPDGFAMSPDEVVVIAEVCARLTREGFLTATFIAGDIYRLYALPARDSDHPPAAPVHTAGNGAPPSVFAAPRPEIAGGVPRLARPSPAMSASA